MKSFNYLIELFKTCYNTHLLLTEVNKITLNLCTKSSLKYQVINHNVNHDTLRHLNDLENIDTSAPTPKEVLDSPSNINVTTGQLVHFQSI